MTKSEQYWMLLVLKALSDETRLTMLTLLAQREHNVGELAELLGKSEATISHHLSQLREVGLVSLRMDKTQRFSSVNQPTLKKFKGLVGMVEQMPEPEGEILSNGWIDDLDMEEWERDVMREFTQNGRITQLPTKFKKYMVLIRWVATHFEAGVDYTEREVNAIIGKVHNDFATIRRELIEAGYLKRERGGARYWVPARDKQEESAGES